MEELEKRGNAENENGKKEKVPKKLTQQYL